MNDDPHIYSKYCELQKSDTDHLLRNYSNLIKWKSNARILDIGSAEGSVSLEALLPKIPPNFQKLVLSDISPRFVNFARRKIDDNRVDCMELDIAGPIPAKLHANFDHVFSFYCLQHIDEKRTPQAMRNIFDLLKPGGRVLMSIMATCPLYDLFRRMVEKKKWPSSMSQFQKAVSPYHECKNPHEKLRRFLEEAGFDVELCEYEQRSYAYRTWNYFLGASFAIIPFSKISSETEQKQFIEDFMTEAKRFNLIEIENEDGIDKIRNFYSVLVAVASKPSQT